MTPAAGDVPLLRRLHVQAALVVVPVLVARARAMSWMAATQTRAIGEQASQQLNLGLAAYIVAHQPQPLVGADGRVNRAAVQAMATQAMMINPAIEVYLLDAEGTVRAHALADVAGGADPVGARVDLAPVRALAGEARPTLPVLGDDPRHAGRRTIFSAAPLPASNGYLYVVLEGLDAQVAAQPYARSRVLPDGAMMLVAATLLAGLVLVVALVRLTRPLHRLTQRVRHFHRDEDDAGSPAARDEIGLLEDAIVAMQARIGQQLERLQEADRMRRELVSNISHDLRTPLSNIQGYVETVLLRADRLDAATREQHLRTALRHVDLLGKRIADLFQLSTLDAGRVTPRLEVFCLAELLQDVVASYQLDAGRRGVALVLDAGSQLAPMVRADLGLIERVLQNLVDNALRHTPEGGSVTLALEPRDGRVEVSVRDTGTGIAHADLPHIFERYWRAENESAATLAPGSSAGLGLAIVKRILDLHGSAVQVRSAPREGACFVFGLPVAG